MPLQHVTSSKTSENPRDEMLVKWQAHIPRFTLCSPSSTLTHTHTSLSVTNGNFRKCSALNKYPNLNHMIDCCCIAESEVDAGTRTLARPTDSQYKQKAELCCKTKIRGVAGVKVVAWFGTESLFCCQVITDIALWLWPSRLTTVWSGQAGRDGTDGWRADCAPFAFLAEIPLERFACFLLAAAAHL